MNTALYVVLCAATSFIIATALKSEVFLAQVRVLNFWVLVAFIAFPVCFVFWLWKELIKTERQFYDYVQGKLGQEYRKLQEAIEKKKNQRSNETATYVHFVP